MANLSQINIKLSALNVSAGFDQLVSDTSTKASSIQALNSSSLGGELNQTLSGVQALNTTTNPLYTIALLTQSLPGLSDQLVSDISSSKSDLETITGTEVENSYNTLLFTSGTAEGVKNGVNTVATPSDTQMNTILTNVVPKQYSEQVPEITEKDYSTISNEISTSSSNYLSSFSNLVGAVTGNVLQDIVLTTDLGPISQIENLGVPSDQSGAILVLLQEDRFNEAVRQVVSITELPVETVETELAKVPTDLSGQIESAPNDNTAVTFEPSSKNNEWNGASTPEHFFDIIPTLEQLHVEMVTTPREITELIFFGHETTVDQTIKANDIHKSYIAEGIGGIPFHLVILPNGNIQRGRPFSKEGEYSEVHKLYSIGIVVPVVKQQLATMAQIASAKLVMRAFYDTWPGGRVLDAREDTTESEISCGMNIPDIVASFNKVNKGSTGRSLSTTQLITTTQGSV